MSGNLVAFNNYLKEFVGKLQTMFPENEKIAAAKNLFHAGIIADKELYIRHFKEYVIENFRQDILSRNEQVLLSSDFSFIPDAEQFQDEFKGIWVGMKQQQKDPIWDYLKVLTVLATRHYSERSRA